MNCEWVKANVVLYVYDELADDLRYELEQHVDRCSDCASELRSLNGFRRSMSAAARPEPSPNLLAASRIRLGESLEAAEQSGRWRIPDPMSWLRRRAVSPALAAVLLMVGFAGGAGTAWRIAANNSLALQPDSATSQISEASIGGIRSISHPPGADTVTISYDTVTPRQVEGSLNDERIQQLLLYATRSNANSGLRMDSVDLLTRNSDDAQIREALKASLLYDSNPGVRLKALEALGPVVKDDISIRNAVLEALQNDSNPGVRAEAIHLLQPVRVDSSVRQVLRQLAEQDQAQFIRKQSRRMLATLPEID